MLFCKSKTQNQRRNFISLCATMPILQIKDASFTTYVARVSKKIIIFAAVNEKATMMCFSKQLKKSKKQVNSLPGLVVI